MRARYFQVDDDGNVHKLTQSRVEKIWAQRDRWDDSQGERPVRTVTILCDETFTPLKGFLVRADTFDGMFTDKTHARVSASFEAVNHGQGTPEDQKWVDYQCKGWPDPEVLRRNLAVALDVPERQVPTLWFGGPLYASWQLCIGVRQALNYFNRD